MGKGHSLCEITLVNYYVCGEVKKDGSYRSFAVAAPGKKKRYIYAFDSVADMVERMKVSEFSCLTIIGELVEKWEPDPNDPARKRQICREIIKANRIAFTGEPYKKQEDKEEEKKEEKKEVVEDIGF